MKQAMNQGKKNSSVHGKSDKQQLAELVSVLKSFDGLEAIIVSHDHTLAFGHSGFLISTSITREAWRLGIMAFISAAFTPLDQRNSFKVDIWFKSRVCGSRGLLLEGFEGADLCGLAKALRGLRRTWRMFLRKRRSVVSLEKVA
jgi:hypothetical protein